MSHLFAARERDGVAEAEHDAGDGQACAVTDNEA
jgi:hypothetical protein